MISLARVDRHRSRREFLGLTAAAGLGLAAACSRTGGDRDAPGSGPVTIAHAFGETTVPAAPSRVVSAGLTEQDDLLAVGVVPVAVTKWFGDQPSGVWPWAQEKLGSATPTVLSLDNGIQVDAIAALKPDLIVAVNAGLDAETYRKLAGIAPTVAQSGGDAFFEPWKDQAATIGRAVFKQEQMTQIIAAVDEKFARASQPAFADRSVALMRIGTPVDLDADTVSGWRTDFLAAMGLRVATRAADADVVIWPTETDAQRTALPADPVIAGLASTRPGRNVFTTGDLAAAIAYASPLSYPVVADLLPPLLVKALG